jgi:signal transduction histidine kinase
LVHIGAGGAAGTVELMTGRTALPDFPWMLPAELVDERPTTSRRSARDWLVDIAVGIVALVGTAVASWWVLTDAPHEPPALEAVDLTLGWLSYFAIWVRRRWPAALGLAMVPLALLSMSSAAAQVVVALNVAIRCRFSVTLGIATLGLATSVIQVAVRPDPDFSFWGGVVFSALLTGLVMGWGLVIRARRQLVFSLRDRAQRAESEQQLRVAQARQQERTRIAREMHDVLAHRISLVSLHAGALEYRPDAEATEVAKAAGVIRASAHEALQDLRTVIGVLRDGDPESDHPQPTLADLPALVDEARGTGGRVRLHFVAPEDTPGALGRNAYRIVQEGLTNARKHAPGTAVDVSVTGDVDAGLTIELTNPPPAGAPPPIPGSGCGLVGLAERVGLAGGRLTHGADDSGRFTLRAWLPWPT